MTKAPVDSSPNRNNLFKQKIEPFNCQVHGIVESMLLDFGNGFGEPFCYLCLEEKKSQQQIQNDRSQKSKSDNERKELIRTRLQTAGIPNRFANKGFNAFTCTNDNQLKKKSISQDYANHFDQILKLGRCMIFCGSPGTGKTLLACSIIESIIQQHQKSCLYITIPKVIRMLKEAYRKEATMSEKNILDKFTKPPLLVLDEVGMQYGSAMEKVNFFDILDQRYQDVKPTILISNQTVESLKSILGPSVIDRFRENGGAVLKFEGKSHRATATNITTEKS